MDYNCQASSPLSVNTSDTYSRPQSCLSNLKTYLLSLHIYVTFIDLPANEVTGSLIVRESRILVPVFQASYFPYCSI